MDCLYILELQRSRYFIGRSVYPRIDIQQHEDGTASEWTKQYLPIVHYTIHPYDEKFNVDKCVEIYMMSHGYNNVRGGSYKDILASPGCRPTPEQIDLLEKKRDQRDASYGGIICNRCGIHDHQVKDCYFGIDVDGKPVEDFKEMHLSQADKYKYSITCARCNRQSHVIWECKQTHFEDGTCIRCGIKGHGSNVCTATTDKNGGCSRCGREGHNSDECTAIKHIKGYNLANSICVLL